MTKQLPLFPLQIVVFPGEEFRLHIFEERYRELIKDCEEEDIEFGIPAYIDDELMDIATGVRLIRIDKRYPSGESDVSVLGTGLYQIHEFHQTLGDKPYSGADVEAIPYSTDEDYALNEKILFHVRELFRMLNIQKELPPNPVNFLSYDVAHHVGFSLRQEYQFLSISHAVDRQEFLMNHLEKLLPTVRKMENLRLKAMMNGAHKNIIPPKV